MEQGSKAISQSFTGSLQESIRWATGEEAEIEEVECWVAVVALFVIE